MCFEVFDVESKYANVADKEELMQIDASLKTFKQALIDLMAMGKAAATRLTNNTADCVKKKKADDASEVVAAAQATEKKRGRPKKAAIAQGHARRYTESGIDHCRQVDAFTAPITDAGALLRPFLYRLRGEDVIDKAAEYAPNMLRDFKSKPEYAAQGRIHKKLGDPVVEEMEKVFGAMLPPDSELLGEKIPEAIRKYGGVTAFGVAQGRCTPGWESSFLPCLRLVLVGTREVYAVRATVLMKHLSKDNGQASLLDVREWLKKATVEEGKMFQEQLEDPADGVQFTCVGPREVIYMPSGYVYVERARTDVVGLRRAVISAADFACLSDLNAVLISMKKENAALQETVDALSL